MESADNVRVQFDMPAARLAEFDDLLEPTGLRTRRELFDNALSLFEWAVAESQRGRRIASLNEETNRYQPIVMPALRSAARHAPQGLATNESVAEGQD